MKYIAGARIITETEVLENYVLGFDDKFSTIIPINEFQAHNKEVIEAKDFFIAPGLIDMHIHGSGGMDTMNGTEEAIETISAAIAKNGVTAFLATTMTMDLKSIYKAFDAIRSSMEKGLQGAKLLGAHMEGPFINAKYKGAQVLENIIEPKWELVEQYRDIIKLVTLAPEVPGALDFIKKLKQHNIIASAGHSAATYEETMAGIEEGISHCTHLFNAMSGVHHRTPGVASAALSSDIYCELIADKIHIHPGNFELIRKAKGADKVILITDCTEAGGMEDGEYSLGGQPIFVKDGAARLKDGTLAGSVLKLNKSLKNVYENTNAKLHEVLKMASLNPAKELKIDGFKGSIAIGKDADFSLMDRDFNVKATYVEGKCVSHI